MSNSALAPTAIEIRGLSLTFATSDAPVVALSDIDLTVRHGEFVAFIGPAGCGKTTLMRVIADLAAPSAGHITVNGVTPCEARLKRAYGYVFQAPALYAWRNAIRNVMLPLEIMGYTPQERKARAAKYMELVGLTGFERKSPWQLSGGMQQRVSLVRGFALGAPILLMDEPFAALDEITRAEMRYLLLDLWQRTGTTVVFVTHSITEAVILSDRVVVMAARPGRIAAVEPISLGRPRHPEMEDAPEFHEHVRVLRDHLQDHS